MPRSDDSEYQEKLESIAIQLGIEGESTLFELARTQGVYFFPKYLNEITHDEVEDADKNGSAIGDHFPDPRSHGQ